MKKKQNRENVIDDEIALGRSLELATTTRMYVNSLDIYEIENEIL